jgi:hypothetical protein
LYLRLLLKVQLRVLLQLQLISHDFEPIIVQFESEGIIGIGIRDADDPNDGSRFIFRNLVVTEVDRRGSAIDSHVDGSRIKPAMDVFDTNGQCARTGCSQNELVSDRQCARFGIDRERVIVVARGYAECQVTPTHIVYFDLSHEGSRFAARRDDEELIANDRWRGRRHDRDRHDRVGRGVRLIRYSYRQLIGSLISQRSRIVDREDSRLRMDGKNVP